MANQISTSKDFGIELSDVTAYHPAATAQAPPAIQGLSLSIGPGEHVAVIGPSGSGKTSCLLVIAAALKVKSGIVSLNHQSVWELATLKLQELRGNLFFAPQTPPLPPRSMYFLQAHPSIITTGQYTQICPLLCARKLPQRFSI